MHDGYYHVTADQGERLEDAIAIGKKLNQHDDKKQRVYDDSEEIDVKQFKEIFHCAPRTQSMYRNKFNLPFRQKVKNGTVTYIVGEVREWLYNFRIQRKI